MNNENFKTHINPLRSIIDNSNKSSLKKKNLIPASSLNSNVIATCPIFQNIRPDLMTPLLAQCQIEFLREGEILLTPGEENHYMYWLLSGHLQVYLVDFSNSTSDRQVEFKISPGDSVNPKSDYDLNDYLNYDLND